MTNKRTLEHILADNNQMPWFLGIPDNIWWLSELMWEDAVSSIKLSNKHPLFHDGDLSSFTIVEPLAPIFGVGDVGRKYIDSRYPYLDMPWSDKVIILTPDVLVLVSVRREGSGPHLREVVKRWLDDAGTAITYDPATNDALINNKKFMGTHAFHSPHGWTTEFGMMTIRKDEDIFENMLPDEFKRTSKGHELTGISDEVDFIIDDHIEKLFAIAQGDDQW